MASNSALLSDPSFLDASPLCFLPPAEAAALLARARVASFKRGEEFLRAGAVPDAVLISADGGLRRISDGAGAPIAPRSVIGLDVLMSGRPSPYSVVAEQDAVALALPWPELKARIAGVPHLESYLRALAESAAIRAMDLGLDEMGCSRAFRVDLLGALEAVQAPPETTLIREGETPSFLFFVEVGTVQAFGPDERGSFAPMWIAPSASWQLFDEWATGTPLPYRFKTLSKVDYHRASSRVLESLRERHPADFAGFEKFARRIHVENESDESREELESESLEDAFPVPPRRESFFRFSFPWVQQNDETDCGPACMAMISRYYGNDLPIHYWRSRVSTNQRGTALFDLSLAAEKAGFVCRGLQIGDFGDLEPNLFPLIALRGEHYVVVYRASSSRIVVGDPAVGVLRTTWREFSDAGFQGIVLLMKPTERFYQESSPTRGYWHYIAMFRGLERELVIIAAASLAITALQMVPAFLFQFILDQVLAKRDERLLFIALAVTLAATTMMILITWLRRYYLSFITARYDFAAGSAFMRKVFSLPYSFIADRHVGDFTRRLAELEGVKSFFTDEGVGVALSALSLLVYGVALFKYSPLVAVVVYACTPLLLLASLAFSKKLKLYYGEIFRTRTELEGLLADLVRGMATIKTLGAEVASRWRFEEAGVRVLRVGYDSSLTAATMGSIDGWINGLVEVAIIGLSAYLAIEGKMTAGQVVSVSMLAHGVMAPFNYLAMTWSRIQQMSTVLDRLNDIFLAPSESTPDKRALVKERLRGDIEFRDVWFRYGGEATDWVLKGMSFHIAPGQSVAVVGASGSGKSTLALLTARLFEPTKGTILIDGRDYREYDRQWLRKQVGLLLQDTNLFHGDLISNIAYGDPRPDVARVERAAELADAKGFIQAKSNGFDYMITHGGHGLSGGQRQRLAIARILYADPPVLFMDEATSSLDAESERNIVAALRRTAREKTVISIAHRYNTVMMSDYAMVISDGRMVEFGTHAQLIARDGHYARLFRDQIGAGGNA